MRTCTSCGGPCPHYPDPTRKKTRKCLSCLATYKRERRVLKPEQTKAVALAHYHANRAQYLVYSAKARALAKGIPFSLTAADVVIPDRCPALGIPLVTGPGRRRPNTPSLDRLEPALGYVPGNVVVISDYANRVKNSATVADLRAIADWLERELAQRI